MTGEPGGEGLMVILCAAQLADFNLELPVSSSGCVRTQDQRAVEDAVRRSTRMRFSTEGIEVSGVKGRFFRCPNHIGRLADAEGLLNPNANVFVQQLLRGGCDSGRTRT
jgi:hypothetical protein